MNEQLSLSLFDEQPLPEPFACEFEVGAINVGGGKPKSKCSFRGAIIWTNCRECGHCVWDGWHQQGSADGLASCEDDEGGD